jgi:hypothetical protein
MFIYRLLFGFKDSSPPESTVAGHLDTQESAPGVQSLHRNEGTLVGTTKPFSSQFEAIARSRKFVDLVSRVNELDKDQQLVFEALKELDKDQQLVFEALKELEQATTCMLEVSVHERRMRLQQKDIAFITETLKALLAKHELQHRIEVLFPLQYASEAVRLLQRLVVDPEYLSQIEDADWKRTRVLFFNKDDWILDAYSILLNSLVLIAAPVDEKLPEQMDNFVASVASTIKLTRNTWQVKYAGFTAITDVALLARYEDVQKGARLGFGELVGIQDTRATVRTSSLFARFDYSRPILGCCYRPAVVGSSLEHIPTQDSLPSIMHSGSLHRPPWVVIKSKSKPGCMRWFNAKSS